MVFSVAQAVPPPVVQQGANCSSPVYASDRLVCEDQELRAIDAEITRRSSVADAAELSSGSALESNETWFRRRSRCAFEADHRGCLLDAYHDRGLVLDAVVAPQSNQQRLKCERPWSGRPLALSTAGNDTVIVREGNRLLAVATSPLARSAWKPALTFRQRDRNIVFKGISFPTISCRLRP